MKPSVIFIFVLICSIVYFAIKQNKKMSRKTLLPKKIMDIANQIVEGFQDIKDIRYGSLGGVNSNCNTANKWIKIAAFTISGNWDARGFTLEVYPRIRYNSSSRQTLVCLVRNNTTNVEEPYVSLTTMNEGAPNSRLIADVRVVRTGGSGISNNTIEVWIQFKEPCADSSHVMYYLYKFKTNDFIADKPQAMLDKPAAGQSWGINDRIDPIVKNGEIVKDLTGVGNFRATAGEFGTILRQDGTNFYLLNTNKSDPNGGWNGLRPFYINNSSGDVGMAHNLNVGGTVNSPNVDRVGGDWLRINGHGQSVGRTALYGKLSINDTRNGMGGLVVGDWDTNPGQGGIIATSKLCINNTCLTEEDLKRFKTVLPKGYINIVNRRPLFGVGTKTSSRPYYGTNPQQLYGALTYGPFGYNVPAVAAGATRKFRMYAVYTDGLTGGKGPVVRMSILNANWQEFGKFVDFQFPITWGGLEEARDAFSTIVDDPQNAMHAVAYTFCAPGSTGNVAVRWQYIELQTLDIF